MSVGKQEVTVFSPVAAHQCTMVKMAVSHAMVMAKSRLEVLVPVVDKSMGVGSLSVIEGNMYYKGIGL